MTSGDGEEGCREPEVVSVELPAPLGWKKTAMWPAAFEVKLAIYKSTCSVRVYEQLAFMHR